MACRSGLLPTTLGRRCKVPFEVAETDDVKRHRAQEGLSGGAGGAGTGELDAGEQSVTNGSAIIGSGAIVV